MEDLLTRGAIDEARSIREPLVVHEGLGVLKLLDMFRLTRVQLAFITDEYGGIQGLVTSTDMLEAIAGEFPDDEDGEHWLTKIGDGHWRVEGWSDVRHLSVAIGRDLATQGDNYSTIAGYVMWYLGRLPELGDRLERDDLAFTVTKMEGRRIAELEIEDCPSRNGD